MLINDPAFAQQLRDTVANVNTIVANVNAGKGTLGKLTTDDTAYTNLNKLLTQSTLLVDTLRQDPKKYLPSNLKVFYTSPNRGAPRSLKSKRKLSWA